MTGLSSHSSIRKVFCALILGWLLGASNSKAQSSLEGLIFKDALQVCVEAVGSGDLQTAADLFASLERIFGSEDEYLDDNIQKRVLPMRGLAELGAGRYTQAAATLESLWANYPEILQQNAALLYAWARAHKGAQNYSQALEALDRYRSRVSGTTEAHLASLEIADLFFVQGNIEEGLAEIDTLAESTAPESLKMQGQLKAVQANLDEGYLESASRRMLAIDWSVTTMPELAQLAFSALRCGENAMASGQYEDALNLFQLVPPKSQLLKLQAEKLEDLKLRIVSGRRRALMTTHRHQQQYLVRLEAQLEQQLTALQDAEDYTPSYFLRYGQCLLLNEDYYKAWLVFEFLSLNESYPQSIREEAHYRWVVSAHQLQDWEEALTIARNFVSRYPDSKLAPQALYLIAKAHLEQRRYPESNEVLDDLILSFSDHSLHGRWLFTRGFNFVVLEQFDQAREDFASYTERYPKGQLQINARLWNALTYFFERDYPTCIELLVDLASIDTRHLAYPEILYRLASTYYSARNHKDALDTINRYLERFGRHSRVDEARVLRGDILMGTGDLDEAVLSFQDVSKESPDMFLYGLFQRGKIFRAQERYEAMIALFEGFLEDDESPQLRVSEALYWLGWAHLQTDSAEEAYPIFESALATHGDDPQAAETQSILEALRSIRRKEDTEAFNSWLEGEIQRAEESQQLTYHSRLILFQNKYSSNQDDRDASLIRLSEMTPLEKLDPEALGRVGLILLETSQEDAKPYFEYLIAEHYKSPAKAMAYLGLAKLAYQTNEFHTAEEWLNRSSEEVPVHPHMNESQLLLGEVLSKNEKHEQAIGVFETLLRLKSARGRSHAQALDGIANAHLGMGDSLKATAYYQRIYNMYRAYPDLVAQAYWKSANLFESMDRIPDAVRTLQEMLGQTKLKNHPEWSLAEERLEKLLPLIPVQEKESVPNPNQEASNE